MRPIPLAAGFQPCRHGSVSRAAKLGSSAIARRDTLSAMPLAITDVTNSRREILIEPRLSSPRPQRLRIGLLSAIRCLTCAVRVRGARAQRGARRYPRYLGLRAVPRAIWDPSPA